MKLGAWLIKNNLHYKEFAEICAIKENTMFRYLNGTRKPSLKMARRIEKFTNGEVTIDGWFN